MDGPTEFGALVERGDASFEAGDRRAAGAFYTTALNLAKEGKPFDRQVAQAVLSRMVEIERGYETHLLDSLAKAGFPASEWHPRFARSLAMMTGREERPPSWERYPKQPTTYFYPDLAHAEFYDPTRWDWADAVRSATGTIRDEAKALIEDRSLFGAYVKAQADRPQGDVHGMLENDNWSTFELTRRGLPAEDRIARTPETWRAISSNAPQCKVPNRAPAVMFSLLEAGSRIPPHTGSLNARLICHLPLIVPGNGALRVGSTVREWHYGELLVFDDTIEHEAWNDAATDRLVLIFDIWHPDLEEVECAQIAALFEAVDTY